MSCDSGSGSFLGFTVVLDAHCRAAQDNNNQVTETQALVRKHDEGIEVSALLKVNSFGAWTVSQDVFDKPRVDDGCGAFRRKGFGCDRDHDAWTAEIDFNGEFDLSLLVGAEGTIRRTSPEGDYWEGTGRFVSATVIPAQTVAEDTVGEVSVQWRGGKPGEAGYPTFTKIS